MLIVKKFGGTSVGDQERIMNVARRCAEEYSRGNDVVLVLSAMGKTTDILLKTAREINPKAPKRELDMLMTTGEQTSVALMAIALDSLGIPAISLNAFQVRMETTSVYGNARLKRIDKDRIRHELSSRKIVIVTGFQGVNRYEDQKDHPLPAAVFSPGLRLNAPSLPSHFRPVRLQQTKGQILLPESDNNGSFLLYPG